jgi:eukaryotic-like serine/threonine-protein kinase
MPLIPGTRLGPYEIQSPLGSGGMGEVYRARDTKLQRNVAIKVIVGLSSNDPEHLMRFGREARLLASLNHPRIAQIYGFEDFHLPDNGHAAVPTLVMELVEGPTLADRLAGGALPLGEALAIARQIAEALEAAHEQGVIHRDLKPANVKVMDDGAVKVLDFGLAKALVPLTGAGAAGGAGARDLTPDAMNSPTHASRATEPGMVLGTAAYMAPEQARGKLVDKRADIWAFGVVLYEMLAGRRPFEGETFSDLMASVLRQDIDWTRLPADVPDEVYRLIRRCLERDPKNRLRDAADARLVIEEAIGDLARAGRSARDEERSGRGGPARPIAGARTSWLAMLGIAAIAFIAAIAGALIARSEWANAAATAAKSTGAAAPPSSIRFAIEPPPDVTSVSNVTVSADGRLVVYEGQVDGESRLFLRRFDALDSRAIAGTEGARWPFLSPDGAWVGFFREAKIFKISIAGGDVLPICDVRGGPGAVWDARGRIIFSRTWLGGLLSVSADGGAPAPLTTPDRARKEIGHWWPAMLPDGRVLFTIMSATSGFNDARIALLDPGTGAYRELFAGARPAWLPSGHIMFYRLGKYQAVRFDLASGRAIGEPFPVLEDAQELDPLGDWPQPVSAGPSGVLDVRPLSGDAPAAPLSMKTGEFPVFLPDGRTIAFVRNGRLVVMPWRSVNGRFEIGAERPIAPLTVGTGWMFGTPYDASRDGRFLALVRTEPAPPLRIRVVVGWDRDVARLDPSDRP